MKQHIKVLVLSLLFASSFVSAKAVGLHAFLPSITIITPAQKEVRLAMIKERLQAIQLMDKSALPKAESTALRKEVRALNKESKALTHNRTAFSILSFVAASLCVGFALTQ